MGSHPGVAARGRGRDSDLHQQGPGAGWHLRERGYLVELEHPEVGTRTHVGIPWKMSGTPCRVRRAAALMGQDTDDMLSSMLGYSPKKIEQLRDRKILY